MQRKLVDKIKETSRPKDLFPIWRKRLESQRSLTKITVSFSEIEKDQNLSDLKIVKIRSDWKIVRNLVSKYYRWVGEGNWRAEKKVEKG